MRLFVLGPDLDLPQPVWMNIFWPQYNAVAECIPTTFLGLPNGAAPSGRLPYWLWLQRKKHGIGSYLRQRVVENLDHAGPNVLMVWAHNSSDINLTRLLNAVWDQFDHTVLNVVDTVQPDHVPNGDLAKFDLITCFCGDLAAAFENATGVRSRYFPSHTDVLNFHSISEFRPIDLIVVGRRDKAVHAPLHRYFNAPEQRRIFIDFVTRTQMDTTAEEEFRLLMNTYARSKAAFCYEPSAIDRFKGRSPLTARWIHAWAAGCTVFGSKPQGRGVESQTNWSEATIELPSSVSAAIETVEKVLDDGPGLARRGRRNLTEALRRHDTRRRLQDLLGELGIPLPEALQSGLKSIEERAQAVESES